MLRHPSGGAAPASRRIVVFLPVSIVSLLCWAIAMIAPAAVIAAPTATYPLPAQLTSTGLFDEQTAPDVALSRDGTSIVCWQQGFPSDIYARRFDVQGNALGAPFRVNSFTSGNQFEPRVSVDAQGAFVVVWNSSQQDGSSGGIYGQRFDRDGVALGAEFAINLDTLGNQAHPAVEMAPSGAFVVVWDSGLSGIGVIGIFARMYDAAGTPVSPEITVAFSDQMFTVAYPDVAMRPDGGFVSVWRDWDPQGTGTIRARVFDPAGNPLAPSFPAHAPLSARPWWPAVFAQPDGGFGIFWEEQALDFSGAILRAQRFAADASMAGPALEVFTNPCFNQGDINLDADTDAEGNFVLSWQSLCGIRDLSFRIYTADGIALTAPTTFSAPEEGRVALDVRSDGGFRLAWSEYGVGVWSQRYDTDCDASATGDLEDIALGRAPDLNDNGTPDDCEDPGLPPLVSIDTIAPLTANTGPIPLSAQVSRVPAGTSVGLLWEKVAGPGRVLFSALEAPNTSVDLDVAGTYTFRLSATTVAGTGFDEVDVVVPPAVSAYGLSPPAAPVEFLTRPRLDDAAIAADYYQAIDPLGLVDDLDKWFAARGIPDSAATVSVAAGADCCTGAAFFNTGDLGFGRRMVMARTGAAGLYSHYAFSVTNYATVADAVADRNAIATVAMDYAPPEGGGTPITKFYIFQDLDQDGIQERVPSVDLDGNGPKFLPGMCMTCHGGSKPASEYRFSGDTGAKFLPFDINAFEFSSEPGNRRADLEPAFKEFNRGVLETGGTNAIYDLIEGWYGGATLPNATQNTDYVPAGWQCDPSNPEEYTRADLETLYREVIAPSCRNCHASRNGLLDLLQASDFLAWNASPATSTIGQDVFSLGSMPHAKVTYDAFWQSTLPYKPDLLYLAVNYLNQGIDCSSVVAADPLPTPRAGTGISRISPNPFNPATEVRYTLATAGEVRLSIYDLKGRLVRVLDDGFQSAGEHRVDWRGQDAAGRVVSSGSYVVRLQAPLHEGTRIVTLLK